MDDAGPSIISLVVEPITNTLQATANAKSLIWQVPLLIVLILVNAFFAMSEIALISLNDAKLEKQADEGNKKAKQVLKLTKNPSKFLSTIQIGVTLAGFLASASAATTLAEMLTAVVVNSTGVSEKIISPIAVVIITIIVSYFTLVFGELAPKRIGMQIPEKIAFKVVGVLRTISKITSPFVKVLSVSTNGVVRLLGFDPNASEEVVTEEEIRMMVDVGQEKGVIEDVQKEMINNIFEFDDLNAGDIMTHRTDVTAVDVEDADIEGFVNLAIEKGYSRIPVYEGDIDNIIGLIYVKDLLKYVGKSIPAKANLKKMAREAYFIPETKSCGELFTEMSAKKMQMAIVVDEYGGTAGILTLEDLVEAIMGNIQDEYDQEDEEISIINETTFEVDGITDIEEVEEHTGKKFPDGDYDTIGGYIISVLGFLPQDGEMNEVQFENVKFTVLNVEERRIGKVKVEILPEEKKEEKEEERRFFKRNEE